MEYWANAVFLWAKVDQAMASKILRWFETRTQAFPVDDPVKPPKTLFGFCAHYSKGFRGSLLIMALFSALVAVAEVVMLRFMGDLVDILATQDRATFWQDQGDTMLMMMALVLIVLPVLATVHTLVLHQSIMGNFPMAIRWNAHRYLLKQSVGFFQRDFAGRVATKVMQTALSVRETVMKIVDVMVYIVVYFVSMVLMMAQADWVLMLPILTWLLIYTGIQFYFVPKMKKISTDQADARSKMTGRVVDSYTNITTVKLFSHSKRELDYAKSSMELFMDTAYRQMRLVTKLLLSVDVINYLLLFSVAALSVVLWMDHAVTVGVIAIAVTIALRVQGMSKWIMWELGALFENIGTVVDGMNTLSTDVEIQDKQDAKPLHISQGRIQLQDVNFYYNDDTAVFKNLQLDIQPGEKIGLVGRSGAGKSTLVNLLLRFYDIESGKILIDGQDVQEVDQESLRQSIGMITQDPSLLHRTIRENILYGAPDASEEDMIAASQQAHAHDFIMTLQDENGNTGYDVQVGERGVKLSGGQRQRIAIARVLLKNAQILIMDEATSALDSEVEVAIQENLEKLMAGKTVIAIAHRLSTIAAMDRLIVMDQGQIVEQGTHQQLLTQNGIYAQLWARQTGGFLGGV
jgi:ATP-binding cassette subfamily B protein